MFSIVTKQRNVDQFLKGFLATAIGFGFSGETFASG